MPRFTCAVGRALLIVSVLSLLTVPLAAQTVTGTMNGTVRDATGAALPGVTVTVENMDTGLKRVLVTNENGFWNAPYLPVGKYRLNVELAGFGQTRRQNIGVGLNQTTVQDVLLDPASIAETITVVADAPRVNVTDGEVKQTLRESEIMTLPVANQTSFLGLAATFSGYQEPPAALRDSQDNPTLSVGSSVNFNGAGTRGTTFQINGVNNDDSSENQHRQGVAVATIKSFQILSNSFSSEFGRGYGAVVLVQTKSGTNDLTGEVYGYAQDGEYRDRNILALTSPKADNWRRQYGFTGGFPIVRDTLFGFVNYDHAQFKGNNVTNKPVWLASDLAYPRLTLGNDTPAASVVGEIVPGNGRGRTRSWPDGQTWASRTRRRSVRAPSSTCSSPISRRMIIRVGSTGT